MGMGYAKESLMRLYLTEEDREYSIKDFWETLWNPDDREFLYNCYNCWNQEVWRLTSGILCDLLYLTKADRFSKTDRIDHKVEERRGRVQMRFLL